SFEEIAEGLGLASIATVHKHLTALESKGYLKRSFNQSRALELAPKYYKEQRVHRREAAMRENRGAAQTPLLGVIAAGRPIETYEQPETLAFPEFAGAQNVYALEVRGESMIDDHIVEGDYVLVEQTDHVRNGEIVVALVDGSETTLKRFYHEPDGTVRLQPANTSMEPIRVAAAQVAIQGRVLAVHRRYR
ncbi:MAG: transcriptional repressor LexA, partial [Acidobacteria bacterium]|nr:transcriptional repressor LexA [Acidobacteriota bacterium]